MDNLRNLFGQVTTLASSKSGSCPGTGNGSSSGPTGGSSHHGSAGSGGLDGLLGSGSERQRSISGDFSTDMATHQNRAMKQHKAADRDSYYYIMWRS
ncbi:uncharacterized protein LOC129759950 isoform X2 [Uranotaenia lowii]|uniref:uncharacterized protein LOC129759950 isoform X2 n=1 Tax=Uranotaenia lowii TaxID=190385 RepID=UPI00247A932C|nr:uncharacterized protein LOC129759950 isoform X2 [Uranotaenia lowii]